MRDRLSGLSRGAKRAILIGFDVLALWREAASQVTGRSVPCGHYIAEEAPDALLDAALPFLLAGQ